MIQQAGNRSVGADRLDIGIGFKRGKCLRRNIVVNNRNVFEGVFHAAPHVEDAVMVCAGRLGFVLNQYLDGLARSRASQIRSRSGNELRRTEYCREGDNPERTFQFHR